MLNSSHTHCGPAVRQNLAVMYDLDAENRGRVETYGAALTDSLVQVIGAALDALAPADLAVGHGSAGFAINRREPTAQGFRIGVNPSGPVDHDVPVLKVAAPDGTLRAVLFAYACHNTTLGADIYQINGDYAGLAQAELEEGPSRGDGDVRHALRGGPEPESARHAGPRRTSTAARSQRR